MGKEIYINLADLGREKACRINKEETNMKTSLIFAVAVGLVFSNFSGAHAWPGKKKASEPQKAVKQEAETAQPKELPQAAKPQETKAAIPKKEAKQEEANTTETQRPAVQIDQKALAEKRTLIEEKRKILNNTEWKIDLRILNSTEPAEGKEKAAKETDIVTFKDNKVGISSFSKKGFADTNYTLSVQEDGTVVWETMQNMDKATAFWRGELDSEMIKMQGILSNHLDETVIKDYSFVSIEKKNIAAALAAPGKK